MMKFWINRAAISEKEFNDFMQASIEIEREEEKRRKKMGIPTFEELQKRGLTNPKSYVII